MREVDRAGNLWDVVRWRSPSVQPVAALDALRASVAQFNALAALGAATLNP
jgi:hypothetical protein